jgi:DNA-binding beta-propeller fold protein YncE
VKVLEGVPSTYVYPPDGFIPWNLHRITNTILRLLMGGLAFDDPQGVACALLDVHKDPKNPVNDVVVTVIGVNSGAGEILYNIGLKDVRRFGSPGSGERQFLNPRGASIHPNGDTAVADTGNHRVALLKHDGMRLKWVAAIGKAGSVAGQFKSPSGVAFDSKGNLYIADTGNDRRSSTGTGRGSRPSPFRGAPWPR